MAGGLAGNSFPFLLPLPPRLLLGVLLPGVFLLRGVLLACVFLLRLILPPRHLLFIQHPLLGSHLLLVGNGVPHRVSRLESA